jgi:hypothetical protein
MKKIFLFIFGLVLISSCQKEDIKPQEPIPPQPIITDTTLVDTTVSLKNTVWVINKVLNTNMNEELRYDTLVFLTHNTYSFNGVQSTYHLYTNSFGYTLTLNNTVWGHLSGVIYDYNISQGVIENCQFKSYFTNQNIVKIWMYKQ